MLLDMLRNRTLNLIIGVLHLGRLDYVGLRHLAGSLVGHLDNCAVRHSGVGEEVGFQFSGSDLVTLELVSMCKLTSL